MAAADTSRRWVGVILALSAVISAAPDAVLLRCLQVRGVPNLVIFVWKCFFVALFQMTYILCTMGIVGVYNGLRVGSPWVACATLMMTGCTFNTISNLETTSSSALLLFYIAPLWAVVMGVFIIREPLHQRTLFAVAVAAAGVILIFVPSFIKTAEVETDVEEVAGKRTKGSLFGDVLGLMSGLFMAGYLTCCRHASLHCVEAPTVCGVAFGHLASVPIGIVLARHHGDPLFDFTPAFWYFIIADTICIAMYGIMSTLAARFLPSAEVAFLLLFDVLIAPLLVCLVHGEVPSNFACAGASLLTLALVLHEAAALLPSSGAHGTEGWTALKTVPSDADGGEDHFVPLAAPPPRALMIDTPDDGESPR